MSYDCALLQTLLVEECILHKRYDRERQHQKGEKYNVKIKNVALIINVL